jgi:predicted DNA-binding transcriptional regulator AlpA
MKFRRLISLHLERFVFERAWRNTFERKIKEFQMRKEKLPTTYLTGPELMQRYACSHMLIVRKLKTDPDFPRPLYMGRRRLWKIADLEAYERKIALRPRPKNKSKKESTHAAA